MRRLLLVLSVVLVMAAMMVASALPAFAQGNSDATHECDAATQQLLLDAGLIKKANDGQCVGFFAQGGQLPPPPGDGGGIVTPGGNA